MFKNSNTLKLWGRFIVLLLIVWLLLLPVAAFAQDPTAEPAPDVPVVVGDPIQLTVQPAEKAGWSNDALDIFKTIIVGALAFFIVALVALTTIFGGIWLKRYLEADQQLINFGNTPTGKLAYSALGSLSQYVDEPTDPAIIKSTALANEIISQGLTIFRMVLPSKEVELTEDEVVRAAQTTINGLRKLFDGLPSNISVDVDVTDAVEAVRQG